MAVYIKNLKDSDDNTIYPVTRTTAVYTASNVLLETYLSSLVAVVTSATQPMGQSDGDFWYEITSS